MKKTLLATALVAGLAGVAHAENSVTLYGLVDGGYGFDQKKVTITSNQRLALGPVSYQDGLPVVTRKDGSAASVIANASVVRNGIAYGPEYNYSRRERNIGFQSGVANGNRWGLKGIEDLGNGTSAIFKLESGFDLGNGKSSQGGRLFGREAYVGLTGEDWGTFTLGRQYNAGDAFLAPIDPFHTDFGLASATSTFGDSLSGRLDAVAKYVSPNFNGFQFGVGVFADSNEIKEEGLRSALGVNNSNVNAADQYLQGYTYSDYQNGIGRYDNEYRENNDTYGVTTGLSYTYGPLYIAAGYDFLWSRNKKEGFDFANNEQINNPRKSYNRAHIWNVGLTYDLDVVKLHLMYGQSHDGSYAALLRDGDSFGDDLFNPLAGGMLMNGTDPLAKGYRSQAWLAGLTAPITEQGTLMFSYQGNRQKNKEDDANFQVTNSLGYTEVGDEQKSVGHVFSLGYQHQLSKRTAVYAVGSYGYGKNSNHDSFDTEIKTKAIFGAIGLQHRF